MNGLSRHEHREFDREVLLDTRQGPDSPTIDSTEKEDDVEPSFF